LLYGVGRDVAQHSYARRLGSGPSTAPRMSLSNRDLSRNLSDIFPPRRVVETNFGT
jgi:hypothetical protein